jgi:Protein of unknown function with HXXEE motif
MMKILSHRNTMHGHQKSVVSSSAALAAAIFLHTIEEGWQHPAYQQQAFGIQQPSTTIELWLDSLPIFLVLPLAVYLSYYQMWIRDTLTSVAILHPILDHMALTRKWRHRRPGSRTAMALLLPLGVANVLMHSRRPSLLPAHLTLIGAGLGTLISIFLYFEAEADIRALLVKESRLQV